MPKESYWPCVGYRVRWEPTAVKPRITGDTDPLGKAVTAVTPNLVLLRPEAPIWVTG